MAERVSRAETFREKIAAPVVAFIVSLQGVAQDADARVRWDVDREHGRYEMVHENEINGEQTRFRWKTYSEIAASPSKRKIENSFFERLRTEQIELPGTNEMISDQKSWENFVWQEAQKFGISRNARADIKPRQAIDASIKIVQQNMRPAYDLVPDEVRERYSYPKNLKPYNSKRAVEIDATPVDVLLREIKEGVCRHYAVLLDKVYEVFSRDPACIYLKNTTVKRLPAPGPHAFNVIFDLRSSQNNNFFMDVALIDTTLAVSEVRFFSNMINIAEQFPFVPSYLDYIAPLLTAKERIHPLQDEINNMQFLDVKKRGERHITLAFEYLGAIRELYNNGNAAEALALFEDFKEFFAKHKDQYAQDAANAEHDLLYTIFSNIYTIRANHESDRDAKTRIESENMMMMSESYKTRFEALAMKGELKSAVRAGEEYADLFGQSGDAGRAEELYYQLFTFCKKHAQAIGSYDRAMKIEKDGEENIISIKPFETEETLKNYIEYKRKYIWSQK